MVLAWRWLLVLPTVGCRLLVVAVGMLVLSVLARGNLGRSLLRCVGARRRNWLSAVVALGLIVPLRLLSLLRIGIGLLVVVALLSGSWCAM